jgi:hypothetical protein
MATAALELNLLLTAQQLTVAVAVVHHLQDHKVATAAAVLALIMATVLTAQQILVVVAVEAVRQAERLVVHKVALELSFLNIQLLIQLQLALDLQDQQLHQVHSRSQQLLTAQEM